MSSVIEALRKMPPIVYALDFDGVLCDSAHESSRTALLAAKAQWPHLDLPSTPTSTFQEPLITALRAVRPAIETGYENVLLGRLVAEAPIDALHESFVQPVLDDWESLRLELMERWEVTRDDLIETFGRIRDQWIEGDTPSWVSANKFFPGVIDAVNFASVPVYIITTKQKRFAHLLLSSSGAKISEDNIFGLGMGSKIEILKKLIKKHPGCEVVFVEDRYETLEKVTLSMLGQPLQLFLATWGYNTDKIKNVASKHPFISLLDLPSFVNKFQ